MVGWGVGGGDHASTHRPCSGSLARVRRPYCHGGRGPHLTEKHPLRSHRSPHTTWTHLLGPPHTTRAHLIHILPEVGPWNTTLPHTRLELLLVRPESSHIVRLLLLLLLHHLLLLLLLLLLHHIAPHTSHVGPHLLAWVLGLRLHALLNVCR